MKGWLWFNFAALIAGASLILHGVPPIPVLLGIASAAAFNFIRIRRAARH